MHLVGHANVSTWLRQRTRSMCLGRTNVVFHVVTIWKGTFTYLGYIRQIPRTYHVLCEQRIVNVLHRPASTCQRRSTYQRAGDEFNVFETVQRTMYVSVFVLRWRSIASRSNGRKRRGEL